MVAALLTGIAGSLWMREDLRYGRARLVSPASGDMTACEPHSSDHQ